MKKTLILMLLFNGALYAQSNLPPVFQKDYDEVTQEDCDKMMQLWNNEYYMSNYAMGKAYHCNSYILDRELNRVYQQVIKDREKYPEFIKLLRVEQRAWLKTKEAYFDLRYPEGKQVIAMCLGVDRATLLRNRIEYLKNYLYEEGVEGDICRDYYN